MKLLLVFTALMATAYGAVIQVPTGYGSINLGSTGYDSVGLGNIVYSGGYGSSSYGTSGYGSLSGLSSSYGLSSGSYLVRNPITQSRTVLTYPSTLIQSTHQVARPTYVLQGSNYGRPLY